MPAFAQRLIEWQRHHGRHDLPWQGTRDPYRVWLAEIMLQQTQVASVIPYYQRFLARFPTLADLATAPLDAVMPLWSGLGYYARARNLHRCARQIVAEEGGRFPREPARLAALPGIGRSTANAIAVVCFGARVPILDGNVKRVLCRVLGIEGYPGSAPVQARLWEEAERLLPRAHLPVYIQAQMDLGATVCVRQRPQCENCPVGELCAARQTGRVAALPARRPGKTVPEREITLLVLLAGRRILLEERPAAGIWGSLQSLPELPEGEDPVAYCRRHFGARVGAVSPMQNLRHALTHCRLLIRPLLCAVERRPAAVAGRHWLDAEERARAALPTPIRRLLSAIP
jgi:A/G-specific adenine glycosylase